MASQSDDDDYNENSLSISADDSSDGESERESESSPAEEEPPEKKSKHDWNYSGAVMRMMQNMGYQKDKGLGKMCQGRLEPVQTSKQEGRRGLGLKLEGLDNAAVKWHPSLEEIQIPEVMEWLRNTSNDLDVLVIDDLVDWLKIGEKKLVIDDETHFCDPEILANILSSKSVFDKLGGKDMRMARAKSNPFETIQNAIFLNRAAVKMANIDSLCDFMFTNPVDEQGNSLLRKNELLYFADICAGPGGFSEYVLFRKKWHAKGFGFTLRGENDFKLGDFYAGPPETFDPYYGIKGDGNIYDPENQKSFAHYVMKQTDTGVHFVMADGGFSVEGQENIQEILSKQLYLCQCLVALSILRIKGHFVCKLFDLFTPFSVGLVYLMHKCFEEICICKPNTSRPANSERYLICKWKKPNTDQIERHLFNVNQEMWKNKDGSADMAELVPFEVLYEDKPFFEYIVNSNNRIGRNQIVGLIKIAAFCQNSELKETRQNEFKKQCLKRWELPNSMRQAPKSMSENELLTELLGEWMHEKTFLSRPPIKLRSSADLKKYFQSFFDKYFVAFSRSDNDSNEPTMFLSKGRSNVQRMVSTKWADIDIHLEIPAKTLIYAEIVMEYIGEGRLQKKFHALHIIDGIALGGEDIRHLPLQERLQMCDKFAKALNKPYKNFNDFEGRNKSPAPIRCKKLFPLNDFERFFEQMRMYKRKEGPPRLGYRVRADEGEERFFLPGGLIFFTETHPKYLYLMSKTHKAMYYFDTETNTNFYRKHTPRDAKVHAAFKECFCSRLEWKWENVLQVQESLRDEERDRDSDYLYRVDINRFIEEKFTTEKSENPVNHYSALFTVNITK